MCSFASLELLELAGGLMSVEVGCKSDSKERCWVGLKYLRSKQSHCAVGETVKVGRVFAPSSCRTDMINAGSSY